MLWRSSVLIIASASCGEVAPDHPAALSPPTGVIVTAAPVGAAVTTIAGTGATAYADGPALSASFYQPTSVAVDAANNLYVADSANNRVRMLSPASPGGQVTTLAGSGMPAFADGAGSSASFWGPAGVSVAAGGMLYVADSLNNRIRQVSPTGVVTTVAGSGAKAWADGTGSSASFAGPVRVAFDSGGNAFVGEPESNRIRKVSPSGVVTTLAGSGTAAWADGTGTSASFDLPIGVTVDGAGNVYVADSNNNRIRKVAPNGAVTTLAGSDIAALTNGMGSAASFNGPEDVAVDKAGNLYVADTSNNCIRKVTAAGVVTTLAGTGTAGHVDGIATAAEFDYPPGVAVDSAGNVYVPDAGRIRKITIDGAGDLVVSWTPPDVTGSPSITGYEATATAAGQQSQSCTTGATKCAIAGLTSGIAYSVTVTVMYVGGSATSAPVQAIPN